MSKLVLTTKELKILLEESQFDDSDIVVDWTNQNVRVLGPVYKRATSDGKEMDYRDIIHEVPNN